MKLAEFFVKIGFQADKAKVKEFSQGVGEITRKAADAIVAVAGLELGIAKLLGNAFNAAVGFQAFSNQTGLSAQELQRWQIVAAQANVSTEAMASSVSGLQRQLAEIRLGRGNIAPFAMMGIDPRQDAFGVLKQLRRRVPGMDRATATNLISQMGLSPEMMNVLLLSQRKFEEFSRRAQGMSAANQEAFLKSKESLTALGLEFRDFSFSHLAPLAEGMGDLINHLHEVRGALPAIGAAALALGAAFAPMTTAMVGFLAVLDDLLAFKQGRDSLVGTIFGSGPSSKKLLSRLESEGEDIKHMRGKYAPDPNLPVDFKDSIVGKAVYGLFDRLTAGDTNVDIRVDGSGDPGATAEAVREALKRTTNRAGTQTAGKQDRR